jgi:hypothetical protein
MDWLALQVKQTRVEAARLALAEYDRWDRDPWNYQPPEGYDFPTYAIPPPGHFLWLSSTPNPPVLANKSFLSLFTEIVSNNGWSPLNNPMLNKGQKNTSIENVVGFPTFGTVLAYQKLYGTDKGAGVLAETTARLSSESFNLPPKQSAKEFAKTTTSLSSEEAALPPIQIPVSIGAVRSVYLQNLAPYAYRNLETFTAILADRIKGIAPTALDPGKKATMAEIAASLTKGELRAAIRTTVSGDILGNFVVSFVLSCALQEIISESFMLDTKIKLRGELVAELQKQQSAPLPDLSNLLYWDIQGKIALYTADYQPTDSVELERMMGPQEVYRAFLLSTME